MKIEVDANNVINEFNRLKREVPQVLVSAINNTLERAKREWVRKAQENYSVKLNVSRQFVIKRARQDDLNAYVSIPDKKAIGLFYFKHSQRKSGINVEVKVNKRVLLRHAFIATMLSGHRGIFQRTGVKTIPTRGRYAGRIIKRGVNKGQPLQREKIRELFGPSYKQVFSNKEIMQEMYQFVSEQLQKEYRRALYQSIKSLIK